MYEITTFVIRKTISWYKFSRYNSLTPKMKAFIVLCSVISIVYCKSFGPHFGFHKCKFTKAFFLFDFDNNFGLHCKQKLCYY